MDIESLRNKVLNDVADILISCVENKTMSENDFPPIATYVLERIAVVKNEEEMGHFLEELSERWPIFSSLASLQKGHNQEKVDSEVAEGVLHLTKSGKIDEALSLAKNAIQN